MKTESSVRSGQDPTPEGWGIAPNWCSEDHVVPGIEPGSPTYKACTQPIELPLCNPQALTFLSLFR